MKNYAAWKTVFDGFIETRRKGGEKSWQILHPEGEPDNLTLLFQWDSLDHARSFMKNPDLKAAMEKGGVAETPEIIFLKEHTRGTL
ncbi:MAG: antibiotic biosynthesis monooxygenase [Candidatus Eisenbacteria bacterium]